MPWFMTLRITSVLGTIRFSSARAAVTHWRSPDSRRSFSDTGWREFPGYFDVGCIAAGQGGVGRVLVYDLTARGPFGQVEDLGELVLGFGGLGEHPAGFGAAASRGVDQDGLGDAGELVEEFSDGQVQPGAGCFAAHQVGDLQGQDAGEGVDPDVVLGPVVHWGE